MPIEVLREFLGMEAKPGQASQAHRAPSAPPEAGGRQSQQCLPLTQSGLHLWGSGLELRLAVAGLAGFGLFIALMAVRLRLGLAWDSTIPGTSPQFLGMSMEEQWLERGAPCAPDQCDEEVVPSSP